MHGFCFLYLFYFFYQYSHEIPNNLYFHVNYIFFIPKCKDIKKQERKGKKNTDGIYVPARFKAKITILN